MDNAHCMHLISADASSTNSMHGPSWGERWHATLLSIARVSYRSECVAAFAVWWMVVDDGCGSGRNNNIEHREDSSALGHYVTDENSYFC